jgi:hypothetical protein
MFAIEFVAVLGRREPEVVEKMTSSASRLVDADKTAKAPLEKARQKRHATSPDGYRIRAHDGRTVLRWWQR